jgi:hypothetical protein
LVELQRGVAASKSGNPAAKYLRISIMEDIIMDTLDDFDTASIDDELDAQREIIRMALDEIAAEVGTALREAHLDFPVYLTVLNSGDSVATMACPIDPSDSDWSHASAIVCRIIGRRLGNVRLRGRALHCAVANATISATEVMADTGSEE